MHPYPFILSASSTSGLFCVNFGRGVPARWAVLAIYIQTLASFLIIFHLENQRPEPQLLFLKGFALHAQQRSVGPFRFAKSQSLQSVGLQHINKHLRHVQLIEQDTQKL
jgi:hypothetical protein